MEVNEQFRGCIKLDGSKDMPVHASPHESLHRILLLFKPWLCARGAWSVKRHQRPRSIINRFIRTERDDQSPRSSS